MRYHEATRAGRWRKILLGLFLASLGLALAGPPDSRAQYWEYNRVLPFRDNAAPGSVQRLRDFAAPQPYSSQMPSSYNTPDNDLAYYPDQSSSSSRSYYPSGEPTRSLPSPASPSPYGISDADLPWNQAGFDDYNELPQAPQDLPLREAKKYRLTVAPLPQASPAERPEAVLIAYLPDHAVFWVEGTRTRSTGRTRYFQSPPLSPDRKYNYRAHVAWIENGRWVSQPRLVPVAAGQIQTLYLRPAPLVPAKAAMKPLPK